MDPQTDLVHLLFGAVEDLLADLTLHGAPDGGTIRVERLVRTKADSLGGAATLGIAVTARREDEVLSAWVIVGRLALDPWGQPLDRERARRAAERHRDAQHLIGALFADAGFDVRLGLYLLPEACYGFAATSATLDALTVPPAPAAAGSGTMDAPDAQNPPVAESSAGTEDPAHPFGEQADGTDQDAEHAEHERHVQPERSERSEAEEVQQTQDRRASDDAVDAVDAVDRKDGEAHA